MENMFTFNNKYIRMTSMATLIFTFVDSFEQILHLFLGFIFLTLIR